MKIAVLGAGAMGSLYGGKLAEGGHEVTLIDIWAEHVDRINRDGLAIDGLGGERRIKIKAVRSAAEAEPAELVIVFVKATLTRAAMAGAGNLVGPQTLILTLQNGLGNVENLADVVGEAKVIAGTSSHGANIKAPGRVRHAGGGPTSIGELTGRITGRLRALGRVFEQSGFAPVLLSDNVLNLIWKKLIINIAINAITALVRIKNGRILDFPETEEISRLAVLEAVEVARRKGITFSEDPLQFTRDITRATGANRSSMLEDITRERQTEIEVINGAIVREGDALGVPVPVNRVLTGLISVYQRTYPKD
ncbi:MAG: 2-dehydropantoate 2-reductase [Candidatus Adiutrix sp.]|jgi:2-dehydropantoate 2-reductase|nr:2-dehydropantoate 2-reductase [Candidatus Adiutrix sp.]